MKLCGLAFSPGVRPRLLLPDGAVVDDAVSGAGLPTTNPDHMVTFHPVGRAKGLLGAEMLVPCDGRLQVPGDGWDSRCVLVSELGEERPARVFVYRQRDAAHETWRGLAAFEEHEWAMNLACNCRDLRIASPQLEALGAGASPLN